MEGKLNFNPVAPKAFRFPKPKTAAPVAPPVVPDAESAAIVALFEKRQQAEAQLKRAEAQRKLDAEAEEKRKLDAEAEAQRKRAEAQRKLDEANEFLILGAYLIKEDQIKKERQAEEDKKNQAQAELEEAAKYAENEVWIKQRHELEKARSLMPVETMRKKYK